MTGKSETKSQMTAERKITKEDLGRYRDNYLAEMDGAVLPVFSARGPLASGARMLAIGLLASTITYGVGWLLGVSVAP